MHGKRMHESRMDLSQYYSHNSVERYTLFTSSQLEVVTLATHQEAIKHKDSN
jgi:hypothetical protein